MRARSRAAVTGSVLMLPFAALLAAALLGIEPPLGLLAQPREGPNVMATAVVLAAWLLAVVAAALNLRPALRAGPLAESAQNLAVGGAALALAILFIVLIVVDQYPCIVGVPNCD